MSTTDRAIILDILDARMIPYEFHERVRRDVPGSACEIEIHNSGKYGDDNASTMWIFNIRGELLQVGNFIN